MRFCKAALLVSLLGWFTQHGAQAQFYAPETEWHDKAQRLFPVEAARLLAWRENLREPKVVEVTYQVSADTNGLTTWKLNWLDKQGKPLKQFSVVYPQSLLSQGPRFYREVFGQLRTQAGVSLASGLKAKELSERFWQGAELNGMAREDGLRAALRLAATNEVAEEVRLAPAMAGVLVHDTLPSLCGGLTLDSVVLARGAAWLAQSEALLGSSETAPAEPWAPVLFLAGREPEACSLWRASVPASTNGAACPTLFAWWDCFLRRPSAREAFVFATSRRQRRFGMPMLTYYARTEHLGSPLVEVLWDLYAEDPKTLPGLYDYGWFLAASTDVGGGRLLEGAWPAIAREEWRRLFKEFVPSALDYTNYQAKLEALPPQRPLQKPDQEDASLTGLEAFAPLFQMGYEQGTGKLIPAGVLTARDWLNYGWEMNGMQMGARYYFVHRMWGVPELAQTIYKRATRDIEGQAPFFPSAQQSSVFNLQQTLNRLQWVDDLAWRVDVDVQPFAKDTTDAQAARLFHRRCWLRPYLVRWEGWALARAGLGSEVVPLLRRYHQECGLKADVFILEYLRDCFNQKDFETMAGLRQLRTDVAKAMIDPTELQIHVLYDEPSQKLYPEQWAQRYEELFWRNPDCQLEQQILNCYINGGAWKSAKRFYTQARQVVARDVGFSNFLAPQAWMLGFLTGDEELMGLALEDSDTGSAWAMWTHIWDCAAKGQTRQMEAQLDEMIERYESQEGPRSNARLTKGFIPLLPALQDPKSPEHEAALDYFGKTATAVNLRWVLISKYKLSPADAIRFLGGKETDRVRHVLVLSLLQDKEHMLDAIVDFQKNSQNSFSGRVLAQWAARQVLQEPTKIEEKDLRPPGASSLRQAVQAARSKD